MVVFRLGGIYGPGRSILDTVATQAKAAAAVRAGTTTTTTTTTDGGGGGGGAAESRSQRARGSRKFTSRCHVGDVVAVLCASIAQTAAEEAAKAAEEEEEEEEEKGDALSSSTRENVGARAGMTFPSSSSSSFSSFSFSSSSSSFSSSSSSSSMRLYNVVDDEPAPRCDAAAYARKLLNIDVDDSDDAAGGGDGDGDGAGPESARGEKRVRNDKIKDELGVRLLYPTYREGLAAIADGDKTPFE